jgi:hypothetical protein
MVAYGISPVAIMQHTVALPIVALFVTQSNIPLSITYKFLEGYPKPPLPPLPSDVPLIFKVEVAGDP